MSINHVWFQSDFNFSNKVNFTFSAYHTTWPQMTFDLGRWPLTSWTYEGSNITSINQVWFQSDFNFSNEANFTFSAYLIIWPQMTFDLDMWSLTSSTNEGFPCCTYDPSLVEIHESMWKIEANVNPSSQRRRRRRTDNHNNNRGQSDPYMSFLLMQATQKCIPKVGNSVQVYGDCAVFINHLRTSICQLDPLSWWGPGMF